MVASTMKAACQEQSEDDDHALTERHHRQNQADIIDRVVLEVLRGRRTDGWRSSGWAQVLHNGSSSYGLAWHGIRSQVKQHLELKGVRP
jgi:hypothetical protein